MVTVVAINGSRREGSYTKLALENTLAAAEGAGADTDLIDLGSVEVPLYHPDHETDPTVTDLMTRVREAEGVVIGSPVYHGSYSSTFKNFHDHCGFDEYDDTAVGLLALAGGGSYGSTLEHLRSTVRGVHGWVIPQQVGIRNGRTHFSDGRLVTEDLVTRIEELGRAVTEAARLRANADSIPTAD
jgi:azobenzene reductase